MAEGCRGNAEGCFGGLMEAIGVVRFGLMIPGCMRID